MVLARFGRKMSNHGICVALLALLLVTLGRYSATSFQLHHDQLSTQRIRASPLPSLLATPAVVEDVNLATDFLSESDKTEGTEQQHIKRKPFDQRTKGPRTARRMNSRFRYLYRDGTSHNHNKSAMEYLSQYYSKEQILEMNATFPPLLELNVSRHLHPKVRFLKETLNLFDSKNHDSALKDIPPHYFGSRLEKIVAPRHAFLMYTGLPHGKQLFDSKDNSRSSKWTEFLGASRKTKPFCAICNEWLKEQQQHQRTIQQPPITAKQIEAFDFLFGRGILAASRDELVQWNNTWPLEHVNITSAQMLRLLIDHGANPLERDVRGTTVLHWAAGTGNLEAVQELLPHFPNGLLETTERDGATPLHWAAAGANSKEFGTGGHVEICHYLLSECSNHKRQHRGEYDSAQPPSSRALVNQLTKDGNSPLMWAAWSASVDTVKLMIRHRAKWEIANQNGCSVAHWAASGGSLEICQYLHDVVGVNFFEPNHGGNTPLTHAVAFGRVDVARWLREVAAVSGNDDNDLIAAQLAEDFVRWDSDSSESGRQQRRKVLELFQDDSWELDSEDEEEQGDEI